MIKPPLKWAGGKRWLVPYLLPIWKNYSEYRLIEPLCGGLAVTFGLKPNMALLNDINPHLINFFHQLKHSLKIDIIMSNNKELYYCHRARFNQLIKEGKWNTSEAAQLFYYLNHTGYNGLCRFNKSGLFNVPFGRYSKINYMNNFEEYKKIFLNWEFTCGDFSQVETNKNDFVYLDPPYDVEFRQYSAEGFYWEDQVRLANWAVKIDAPVIISNQATKRIVDLYKSLGFKYEFVDGPRLISCIGEKRGQVKEILASLKV
ncbi:Dam family site-specific DNA-(adenine-N6)-methyltransferase [Candidatus Bathyarchaeota archaeon]|nr:Dam family site-specific DNA-(adenine-N6)-methyltransferase [Candidatus Bathyarchaeota archaeon]